MKYSGIVLLSCMVTAIGLAQPSQGAWEVSAAANAGSYHTTSDVTTPFYSSTSESEARGFLFLSLRPGYYLTNALEFEPEILVRAWEGDPPTFFLTGNVLYNIHVTDSRTVPFVAIGFGIGQAYPFNRMLLYRFSSDFDMNLFTIGGGAKFFVSKSIAFRAEYRYQRFSSEDAPSAGYVSKYVQMRHDFFFGFTILLAGDD